MESQVAPIEERVRAMIVDIVRTCQFTVTRNFHLAIAPNSLSNDPIQSSSRAIASTETTMPTLPEPVDLAVNDTVTTTGSSLEFFSEPPHFDTGDNSSLPDPMPDWEIISPKNQNHGSDSGFASLPHFCGCSCHNPSIVNAPNGKHSSNGVPNLQLRRL